MRGMRGWGLGAVVTLASSASVEMAPPVARADAIETARALVGGDVRASTLVAMTPRRKETPVLAWQVKMHTVAEDWRIDVDARTGRIVQKTALRMSLRGSGKGLSGEVRPVEYRRSKGSNMMFDESRSTFIITNDLRNGRSDRQMVPFFSDNPSSWDTDARSAPGAAVDAAYNVGLTLDFYRNVLHRQSWEEKRDYDIELWVHYGDGFENAQYSQEDDVLIFGDGGLNQAPLAQFLDIVAHEFTHAVTARSSRLEYTGQTGALNEAISDIMGACVEHASKPDPTNNWLHGEGSLRNVTRNGGADRDFRNPHDSEPWQPAHMREIVSSDDDNGGVHANSGIVNHAAFLMTVGGTNPVSGIVVKGGIGWDNLAQVFYRANNKYLRSNSSFKDAANATLKAAQELNLSAADQQTIQCAWHAVGVIGAQCDSPVVAATLSNGDSDDDDDATAGDSPAAKAKKKGAAANAPAAQEEKGGCAMSPGAAGPGAAHAPWPWLVGFALTAVRRRARAGTCRRLA